MIQLFLNGGITFATALALLICGDFLSTFFYHIPEHVFGKLHLSTHHSPNQDFYHYAILAPKPEVLLDGFLGIVPYCILAPIFVHSSIVGSLLALVLGLGHVVWRHVCVLNWQTPKTIERLCNTFCIVTPEQHWQHHENANIAFGDIFTFYDRPGRMWLNLLFTLKHNTAKRDKLKSI